MSSSTILRPIRRLLRDAHALAGFLGRFDGRLWKRNGPDVAFAENPIVFLSELYHYLDMETTDAKPASEMIWAHDEELLTSAREFYARAAEALGESDWAKLTTRLEGERDCDVCVVGGGFTGLSAALHLAERDYDVVLLEAERVGWGASGRNGGQLNSGQRKGQGELERRLGKAAARQLWDLAEEAKAIVKDRIARHGIACDFKPGVLNAAYKPGDVKDLEAAAEHLARDYGYDQVRSVSRSEMAELEKKQQEGETAPPAGQ